jgi:c-di-GMP-binding flagellar brake protein YcgR
MTESSPIRFKLSEEEEFVAKKKKKKKNGQAVGVRYLEVADKVEREFLYLIINISTFLA